MNYKQYFKKFEKDPDYLKAKEELGLVFDIADEVLRLRIEKGWSQAELAERAGTKQANISRLESGLSNPSINFLRKVAKALDAAISIRLEKTPITEIYITTDAKFESREAYPVANWPKANIYKSFEHYERSSS
jgi:transcriptional regulator with XRE-family HTH domain